MEDYIIVTAPTKPPIKRNIGSYISPIIVDLLKRTTNLPAFLNMNIIGSYMNREDYVKTYLKDLGELGITFDGMWTDSKKLEQLQREIELLKFKGIITEKELEKYKCKCGKVEVATDSIKHGGSLTSIVQVKDSLFCTECCSECKIYKEKSLVIEWPEGISRELDIVPSFLTNAMKTFDRTVRDKPLPISRNRDTIMNMNFNGNTYNLDTDFVLSNYLQTYGDGNKIVVASNHSLYQMYILNLLNNVKSPDSKLLFVATPYLKDSRNVNPEEHFDELDDVISKRLYLLFNIKWKSNVANWSYDVYKFLLNKSEKEKRMLHNVIYQPFAERPNSDIAATIARILNQSTNVQYNVKKANDSVEYTR